MKILPGDRELFRQIVEHLPGVIWITDPKKNQMIYISPGYEKIWGRTVESIYKSPRSWVDAVHPEDRDRVMQAAMTKQVRGEYDEQYRIIRHDGSIRWIRDRAFPIRNRSGEVYRIVGIAEDITKQKGMESALRDSEARFSGVITISADAIIVVDETQRITLFNQGAEQVFGYEASEVIGQSLDLLLPPRFVEVHRQHIRAFGAGGAATRLIGKRVREIFGRRKDGTEFPAEASISKLTIHGRMMFTVILRDITERKQADEALLDKTNQLQAITDAMTAFLQSGNWREASAKLLKSALSQTASEYGFVGVVVEGPVLRILAHEGIIWNSTVNRKFYEDAMKAYREQGFLEFNNFDNLFGKVITSGKTLVSNDPATDPRSGGIPPGHPPLRHFLGVPIFRGTEVVGMIGVANRPGGYTADEQKKIEIITQAAGVLYDSYRRLQREAAFEAERKQAEEMIQRLAYYDILTGLPNRNLLHDRLQQAILAGQRENKPVALLIMDLDRFKEVNDTLGHQKGDLLLQEVGRRLRNVVWGPDVVARLGGDEFAVLLPRLAAAEHISIVANKILKALEAPFILEGLSVDAGVSIGIALFPEHGEDTDLIIQRADVAMYAAKQASGGYAVYAAKQDLHSPRRLALMSELRHAIENNQLLLHYQPKISLKTGRVIGVEALVRWQHPLHGLIPPDEFILPAERTGLIKPLTLWVLKEAHRQCNEWHHNIGLNLPISVNLSVRNLQDPQLPEQVAELLQMSGTARGWLELEITESAFMEDPARAKEVLKRLSAMGIRLSIDDFGTGYSSLGYLKKLPVDEIKIDKSFVMDMVADEDDAVIVLSIIHLVHNLGLKVVAEGVESQEIWDRLAAFGCDSAQGYYMCRPFPAAELPRWLRESPWGLKDQTAL